MRDKLSNPNYFGPGGSVAPETFSYSTLSTINSTTLAACDIFLGGGSGDISSAEAAAVGTWLASDPDHFVIGGCDSTSQQTCQIFGRPNQGGSSGGGITLNQSLSYNPMTCGGVTGVDTYGGAATAYTVQPTDTVMATFVSGSFAGRPGAFTDDLIAPTFLVTADPDMFLTGSGSTMTSGPIASDDQDVFIVNVFKFALDGIQGRLANPACPADYNSTTDIEVALTASSNSVVVGSTITLFAQVANSSGTGVDDVAAAVPVPAGFTHVSDNGGGDYNSATGAWDIGSLSGLSSETLEIVIRADTVSTPTATLESISQSLPDLDSAPNATFGVDDLGDGLNDDDEATLPLSIVEPLDRSDAPVSGAAPDGAGTNSYGEATHLLDAGLRLGALNDSDGVSLAGPNADGDGADDDGVTFPALTLGQSATISVDVTQAAANDGYLQGWIDWNGDGSFAAGEQVATNLQSASAGTSTINVPVTVPVTAATNQTFARFRWSTTSGLDSTTAASDGEVEDYAVSVSAPAVPFTCSSTLHQVLGDQLFELDITTGLYSPVGAASGEEYNAIGYNVNDNFIYGIGRAGATDEHLIRIDSTGAVADLGDVGFVSVSADINDTDELCGLTNQSTMICVDVGSTTTSQINYTDLVPAAGRPPDIVYIETGGQETYFGLRDNTLITYNADTGIRSGVAVSGATGTYGAGFADNQGNLYFAANSGGLVRVDGYETASPVLVNVGASTAVINNDGAACAAAPPPIDEDFGDAPNTYGDPRHVILTGLQIGPSAPDAETGTQYSADASADGADEDGVTFPTLTQGQSATIPVSVTQVAGNDGYLQGWIDWDGNGDFAGTGEQIALNLQSASAATSTINVPVNVPGNATLNQTIVRFRWSTTAGLDATTAAPDGEVEDYEVTITAADIELTGSVFLDAGEGTGATAHDGSQDGSEAGLGSVTVEAVNGGGVVLATTTSAGDGSYTLSLPASADGTAITVRATAPSGTRHISAAATGATDADSLDGEVAFTVAAGTVYALDFGLVREPRLTEDQVKTVSPGQSVLVPHTFTSETAMTVDIALTGITETPADMITAAIYRDDDCSGDIGGGEGVVGGTITVAANEQVCLLVQAAAVPGASAGSTLSYTLEAIATYAGTGETITQSNEDRIRVVDGALLLTKEVCNASSGTCDPVTGAGFSVANSGLPGDTIVYRIVFETPGPEPVENVEVTDRTPTFSTLTATAPSIVTTPPGLTCGLDTPAAPSAGYAGPLAWACTGTMGVGERGVASFEIRVDD